MKYLVTDTPKKKNLFVLNVEDNLSITDVLKAVKDYHKSIGLDLTHSKGSFLFKISDGVRTHCDVNLSANVLGKGKKINVRWEVSVTDSCDICGSDDIIDAPHMGRNCNTCHPI